MEKLEWLPLYIDKLLSSPAWQDMKDYQRGWYIQLLLRCARSEPLGYVRVDGKLWEIAGAHSRPMWEQHRDAVMACFKTRTMDDKLYLYNQKLLDVMEAQNKRVRRRSPSLSRSTFVKPLLEEVSLYAKEKNSNVDPISFWNFYESKGWKVGNQSMKSWHAAFATWDRRGGKSEKGNCDRHPNSGLTQHGGCYGCYAEENGYGESA